MARRRSRGTPYLDSDRALRSLRPRVALDNAARSTSDEAHNRRKPRASSVGEPEFSDEAIASNRIFEKRNIGSLNNVAAVPAGVHVPIDQTEGNMPAGRLPNIGGLQGDLPQDKLPNVPIGKLPGDVVQRSELQPYAKNSDLSDYARKNSVPSIQQYNALKSKLNQLARKVRKLDGGGGGGGGGKRRKRR